MRRAPPHLVGKRVCLSLIREEDAPALLAFHQRNREHLAPWLPLFAESFWTHGYWRRYTRASSRLALRGHALRFVLRWARRKDRSVLGQLSLGPIVRSPLQSAELGFHLDHTLQGRGLMREALELVIAYAFGPLALHRLVACHVPENERSAALLANLGFETFGYSPSHMQIAGLHRDHVLRALLNPSTPRDPFTPERLPTPVTSTELAD